MVYHPIFEWYPSATTETRYFMGLNDPAATAQSSSLVLFITSSEVSEKSNEYVVDIVGGDLD